MRSTALIFFFTITILAIPALGSAQTQLDFMLGVEPKYHDLTLADIKSTDTFYLSDKNKVRLIGLQGLELSKLREPLERDRFGFVVKEDTNPTINIEERARKFLWELLKGKTLRLEFDVNRSVDSELRTPAYVFIVEDNTFVNALILRQGYADLQIRPPNTKYEEALREAYLEARENFRGIHNK